MTDPTRLRLSVVIPAFNEAERLPATLRDVADYARRRCAEFEIVVVDDGSTDGTAGVIESFARGCPELRSLRLPSNRGKGAAVRAGMLAARLDHVLCLDADNATPVEAFDAFVPLLADHELLLGSRWADGARIARRQPWVRTALGRLSNALIRVILSVDIRDTQCGFKCFRRDAARRVFGRQRMDGYSYDIETVAVAKRLGLRMREVPVLWRDVDGTHVRMAEELPVALWDLARIGCRYRFGRYDGPDE
jgi:dolichyl-phosphate beta-glucosyltransferase